MFEHRPVLAEQVVSALTHRFQSNEPKKLTMVDCTLGAAGHSCLILETLLEKQNMPGVKLIGFDQDPAARAASSLRLEALAQRYANFSYEVKAVNFGNVSQVLHEQGESLVDILLADIGVSSHQLDTPVRGFSIHSDDPVDMRMDPRLTRSASDLLLNETAEKLEEIFSRYGEEPRARHLAKCILSDRVNLDGSRKIPVHSCKELSNYINRILGYKDSRSSPSIRIFQALRIAVNDELGVLQRLLNDIPKLMSPTGVTGMISFHSLEDRIIKNAYRAWENGQPSLGCEFPRGGIVADSDEISDNPRARSARLRVFYWGETRKYLRRLLKQEL